MLDALVCVCSANVSLKKRFIDFRERDRDSICCSTLLCIHCLILVCTLTGDHICNLGILGQCYNQQSLWPGLNKCSLSTRPSQATSGSGEGSEQNKLLLLPWPWAFTTPEDSASESPDLLCGHVAENLSVK